MMTCGHYLGYSLKLSAHFPTQTSAHTVYTIQYSYLASQRSTLELLAKGDCVDRSVDKRAIEEAQDRLGT